VPTGSKLTNNSTCLCQQGKEKEGPTSNVQRGKQWQVETGGPEPVERSGKWKRNVVYLCTGASEIFPVGHWTLDVGPRPNPLDFGRNLQTYIIHYAQDNGTQGNGGRVFLLKSPGMVVRDGHQRVRHKGQQGTDPCI